MLVFLSFCCLCRKGKINILILQEKNAKKYIYVTKDIKKIHKCIYFRYISFKMIASLFV